MRPFLEILKRTLFAGVLMCFGARQTRAGEFYVAPQGAANGDGSRTRPWSLAAALAGPPAIQPGDTIWVRGGTYRGRFASNLKGTASNPIIVRAMSGQSAIVDGAAITQTLTALPQTLAGTQSRLVVADASTLTSRTVIFVQGESMQVNSVSGNLIVVNRGWNATCKSGACNGHPAGAAVGSPQAILTIRGAHTWFWDLEITDSYTEDRINVGPGSDPPDRRPSGIDAYGPGTKLIDLVVHDVGQGVGLWTQATNAELYGTVMYNNGWSAPDRKHGHAVYAQNEQPTMIIRDNIIGAQFDFGMHIYGSGRAFLNNFVVDGNIHFSSPFLIGGQGPARNITVTNNHLYGGGLTLGYSNRQNSGVVVRNNYLPNGLELFWWTQASVTGNFITNTQAAADPQQAITVVRLQAGADASSISFDDNDYVHATSGTEFANYDSAGHMSEASSYSAWKTLGYDQHSRYVINERPRPTGLHVSIRLNHYDPNRANVAIYNWDLDKTVKLDLSGLGFGSGDGLELRNAQNYGIEASNYVYSGEPIIVPMTGWTAATPIGWTSPLSPVTFPEFGAFVLRRTSSPPVVISLVEQTLTAESDVEISWQTSAPATGRVEFGTTPSYGRSVTSESSPSRSHHVRLRGLLPGEVYHYHVVATNGLGRITQSEDMTFAAPANVPAAGASLAPQQQR